MNWLDDFFAVILLLIILMIGIASIGGEKIIDAIAYRIREGGKNKSNPH